MLALLLATFCGVCSTPYSESHDPATTAAVHKPGGKPLKALDAWMKLYRRGKIDYRDKGNIGSKESIAVKYKVRTASDVGNPTWSGDLIVILKATAELGTAIAAQAITEVASVGIEDKSKYTYSQAPYSVRVAAFEALATMTSKEAKDAVAAGARGEWSTGRASNSLRAAALLGLGYLGDTEYVPVVTAALSDGHPITRIHAVEALQRLGDENAIRALIGVVEAESNDAVLVTAAKALRTIYSKFVRAAEEERDREAVNKPAPKEGDKSSDKQAIKPPASARLAVRASIKALGRTNWRADMVLVRLLDDFRSSESIPALITVLERFRDNPKDVATGKLSGLLRVKVHELLVSMTGAVYSAKQPEKWRELWETEKDKIKVAQKRDTGPKLGGTAAAGFVGIPVEGTRVVFILDLSGSMDWPMDDQGGKVKRLDYAKRELLKAIEGLAPDSMFNLVTFNGDDEAEMWNKKLVDASKRNKERFKKFVEKLRPLGGTNLWSGLEAALDIKMMKYGNHYETTVDEIFLLSDGAPSVGDVQDPIEILRLVEEVNRFKEVRINTVFISSQTPPEVAAAQRRMSLVPKELMRRMAKQNGGKFRDV
ncbi:MAG: HEAT repeat protein [Planctomycetota bacterium]|jgi:HEAT repeat protein